MGQIEPGDREEMLLRGILNGDTETSIEPGSRKEAYLKAILEKPKGKKIITLTENSGTPLVFTSDYTMQDLAELFQEYDTLYAEFESAMMPDVTMVSLLTSTFVGSNSFKPSGTVLYGSNNQMAIIECVNEVGGKTTWELYMYPLPS